MATITSIYDRVQAASDWHPADVQFAVNTQIELPVHEFARGLIVQQWQTKQEEFLQRIQSRKTASKWTQVLISAIWQLYFDMWLHRNEAYHSQPETQNTIQQLSNINHEIRRQWSIGTQGLPQADTKHFHHIKLAQLLWKNLHYKQTWLSQVTAARQSHHLEDDPSRPTVRKQGNPSK